MNVPTVDGTTSALSRRDRSTSHDSRAGGVNATVLLAVITGVAMLIPTSPLAQIAVISGCVLIPGSLVVRATRGLSQPRLVRVFLVTAMGLLVCFLIDALVGAVLSHLGISHPLGRVTQVSVWMVISVLGAGLSLWWRIDPVRDTFAGTRRGELFALVLLAIPPLLSLVGVARLNAGRGGTLAILSGFLALAMVFAAVAWPGQGRSSLRLMLLSSSLVTAAWQLPLRGGFLFGGDIDHEFAIARATVAQGVFPPHAYSNDPYSRMLSLTVWPAQIHALSGMSLRVILALLPSLCLVLCLAGVWAMLRERVSERVAATICALLLLGTSSFLREIPEVTRQCYAMVFFVLVLIGVSSRHMTRALARLLIVCGAIGMAVSHYSTAYIAVGAVIVGWVGEYVVRKQRADVVLTTPVTAGVVAAVALWEGAVARDSSGISLLFSSIDKNGLQLLPGTGGILSRWLNAAKLSQTISAHALRKHDLILRHTQYKWMVVAAHAAAVHLVNTTSPVARGVIYVGSALNLGNSVLAELILAAVICSVLGLIWLARRHPELAALAGMALFGLGVSAVLRNSHTVALSYSPSRVEVQMYLMFSVCVAIVVAELSSWARLGPVIAQLRRPLAGVVIGAASVLVVAGSAQLTTLAVRHGQTVAAYTSVGAQSESLPTASDVIAAAWLRDHSAGHLVQSDFYAQYSLGLFGFDDSKRYITSIDPVITDNRSWIMTTETNVKLGRASGGNNALHALFRTPDGYFASTRSILYASSNNIVFGPRIN